ncbi:sugar phosphate isomerase/epimerase family protein [Paenibacillus sp. MBLB4367]|uniref:sugar phosphate isomerase/epimerase family protein n=1 Tax=Paenibacillus sp. MBLB4367 TaxID=3384767 RepID=UPI003907F391
MKSKLAVQLYTLRDACQNDFPQVLRELKRMGWAGVQMAGYHEYDPEELAAVVRGLELQTAGLHISFGRIEGDLEEVMKEARLFGTRDIVCPSIPVAYRTEEGFRYVKQTLNQAAAAMEEHGLRLSYHNHDFEFEIKADGCNGLEYLLKPSAENRILAEIDVYWIKKVGLDPVLYMNPYANRMPLIHLKDMAENEEPGFAEIGTGMIDFRPILLWGERNGIEWYVVEQDECRRDPMACVQTSYTNLTNMIRGLSASFEGGVRL